MRKASDPPGTSLARTEVEPLAPKLRPSWIGAIRCQLFNDHRFETFCDGFKRQCVHCAREEWLFGNPYPRIGEPKYSWKHMDWRRE